MRSSSQSSAPAAARSPWQSGRGWPPPAPVRADLHKPCMGQPGIRITVKAASAQTASGALRCAWVVSVILLGRSCERRACPRWAGLPFRRMEDKGHTWGRSEPAASSCFRGPSFCPSSSRHTALTVAFSGLQTQVAPNDAPNALQPLDPRVPQKQHFILRTDALRASPCMAERDREESHLMTQRRCARVA